MTSLSSACRMTAIFSTKRIRPASNFRGLRTSSASLIAQKFTMPALSPTMIEGNISKWNVKEGDSFSAGDVLLEIETDKASMDVEAQEDGIVAKIIQGDGCKGVKVGTPIGILAEAGDDLTTLDLSLENSASASSSTKESENSEPEKTNQAKTLLSSESKNTPQPTGTFNSGKKQAYPLLPSVQHLMHLHSLDYSAIDKMTPTGPNNRLLKGDVLAYLGQVSKLYPTELSSRISSLSHLDLSNIKIKAPQPTSKIIHENRSEISPSKLLVNLEQPVSFENIHNVQNKLKTILGFSLPEDVFISRATKLANKSIPRSKSYRATPNEQFDSILGLKSKGGLLTSCAFSPTLISDSSESLYSGVNHAALKKVDIIDILAGKKLTSRNLNESEKKVISHESKSRILRLQVVKDDEERAKLFLTKMKNTLEGNPGDLVL